MSGMSQMSTRLGCLGDGSSVEQRIKQLGTRLLPPEPRTRDGKPLQYEIPPPRLIDPAATPQQRVKMLAAAYRAVLKRRYGITSRYFEGSAALESHKEFPKLVALAALMVDAKVAPLAWVLFSFDAWTHTPLGEGKRAAPPTKWVWSKKIDSGRIVTRSSSRARRRSLTSSGLIGGSCGWS